MLYLLADISEHLICSTVDPEDGTDKVFRNVGQQI
jgi:hypothetical protein